MKFRFPIAALLLAALPLTVVAQRREAKTNENGVDAPSLNKVDAGSNSDARLPPSLLSMKPQVPLGPDYVLQGYENEMTLVSHKMSVDLESIERALQSSRITRPEAEYLIQQRYQVAMMQYEVFTALHDALEEEIQRVAAKPGTSSPADSDNTAAATQVTVSSFNSHDQ